MNTIAIIDDDMYIGNMLEELLRGEGYNILRAYSGTEALLLLHHHKPDLVLLDLMLPGLSGEEVLPKIQGVPTIVVSAKVDVRDKVNLLLGGAADYITKPFDTAELLARIAVQLRKAGSNLSDRIIVGDLQLDLNAHTLRVKNSEIRLTKTEFAILKLLMQNPGQVITKSVMLDRISLDTQDCTESSLKQHVSNLRRKLRDVGGEDTIESVWGIGFRLAEKS